MDKHYILRKDMSKEIDGHTVYRIECIKDCFNASKGTIGGYIESEDNLDGEAWIGKDAIVYGNAQVYGRAIVWGNAIIKDNSKIFDCANVRMNAIVEGNSKIFGHSIIDGNARIKDSMIEDNALVEGDAVIDHSYINASMDIKNSSVINNKGLHYFKSSGFDATITPTHITIYNVSKPIEEWLNASDDFINSFDDEDFTKFWNNSKPIIEMICTNMG